MDDDRYTSRRELELAGEEVLVPVCPEQMGGLPTPRQPQEIQGGSGEDVLDRKCRVFNQCGVDVTGHFIRGAEETLKIARQLNVREFIGKSGSPSCGCGQICDGLFRGKLTCGNGVTAALLKRNGIEIIADTDLK
jgi:uncharacterized protein YbbK (DUF523 family)